ncbi:MAG TPA: TetR/AcrR family transcriptional regulator [Candidatus Eisenbacteria bacterium]|nr:TetR/AcrR family transcriptional regulator [Candidatus Eisenbacteria bacterium]
MTSVQKIARRPPSRADGTRSRPGSDGAKRSERTRAAIRESANALFLEQGVDETTVDAICAAAGVSKGTFYLYFHRKEDLLLEYGLQRLRRIRDMLPALIARETFRDALTAILDEVVRGKDWGREVTGRAILEMGTSAERLPVDAPHKLIQPLVEIGQARGEIRRDIPSDALAHFVLRSILGALRDWGLGADAVDRETALNYALTLVFDAIGARA